MTPDEVFAMPPTSSTALFRASDKVAWLKERIAHSDRSACLLWPFSLTSRGYATLQVGRRGSRFFVSHLALHADGRPRPSVESCALHSCDTPACVAPWHLRWGTPLENVADRGARSRTARPAGEANPQALLTEEQVRSIRSRPESGVQIAREFGVHPDTVTSIRRGVNWAHLLDTERAS